MAGVPVFERPPVGLREPWLGVWRHALKAMREQGTWTWELKPLLDEYVAALRGAEEARNGFRWLDALEEYADASRGDLPDIAWSTLAGIAAGLPVQWDRHVKRAALLADQLALTARGRKAAGLGREAPIEEPSDPFAILDGAAERDELAPRRQRKAS